MYDAVIAAVLSERFQEKEKIGGCQAEERFYERFAHTAPLRLFKLLTCVRGK